MGLLGGVCGEGGSVNNFLCVDVCALDTADNVGGQGFSFLLRKSTPAVTGAFGDLYTNLVVGFGTILTFSTILRRRCPNITFFITRYHKNQTFVNSAYCTNLVLYIFLSLYP